MATSKAAAAKKAAAAVAEKSEEPRTIDFRGITLELPTVLPASIAFDMAEMESGAIGATTVIRLVTSVLGVDQVQQVRNRIALDGDKLDDLEPILTGLSQSVFEAFGMTVGESEASAAT